MLGKEENNIQGKSSKTWRSLNEVSLAGLRVAVDPRSPPLRRVFWSCLLVICFFLMIAQCKNRISHYMEEPVRVRVKVKHNSSLEYPAITVCGANKFPQDMNFSKTDPPLLGLKTQYSCWFGRGIRCSQRGSWELSHTILGPCFTYTLENMTVHEAGTFHNLFLRIFKRPHYPVETYVRVYVHPRHQNPALSVLSKGIIIDDGWSREIKLELRKFQLLNTRRTPCLEDSSYSQENCQVACFSHQIFKVIGCRLPYMPADDNKFINSKSCSGGHEEAGMDLTNLLIGTSSSWSSNCSCPKSCYQTSYRTFPETTLFMGTQIKTRVFYEALVYEQVSEDLAYHLISLLCDIGATLGLLMGASVLTVCELLEVALARLAYVPTCSKHTIPSPIAVPKHAHLKH